MPGQGHVLHMRMLSKKELNQMESLYPKLMESLYPKLGSLSCSPAGFTLGLPSRRPNMNVQSEVMGFGTGVQHGSNFRRDLPWASSHKHILQLNSWRGGRMLLPALPCTSYLPLFLQIFLHGIFPRVLNCMTQECGTAQSYQSATGSRILKKCAHGPMSYRP